MAPRAALALAAVLGLAACSSPQKGDSGPVGPTGSQGTQGAQGLQGAKGDTGAQGLQGAKGDTGAQGLQGPKGDTGAQGLQGPKGDTGAQGAQGIPGLTPVVSAAGPLHLSDVGDLSIDSASDTDGGVLSTDDWRAFNAKVSSVSAGDGLALGGTAAEPKLSVVFGSSSTSAVAGNDARLSDARPPLANSAAYIQNAQTASVTPQAASISISGNATIQGDVTAGTLSGDGSGLTALNAGQLHGAISVDNLPAAAATKSYVDAQVAAATTVPAGLLGTGADGSVTLSADTVLPAGASPQYADLFVSSGFTLTTAGELLVLHATGTVTIAGTISVDGKGSPGGLANGLNTTGSPGANGKSMFIAVPGTGGLGGGPDSPDTYGNPSGGGGAFLGVGGTGGVRLGPLAGPGLVSNSAASVFPQTVMGPAFFTGAGGGGGGGRPSVPNGGNGGAGGGCLIIVAKNLVVQGTGVISANGANGVTAGGGGSGGFIFLSYRSLTNDGLVRANGGAIQGTAFGGVNTTLNGPAVDGSGTGGGSSGVIRAVQF